MNPMGGNREWPDRKASLLRKEPGTECYRAAGHSEAWASEDSMGPVEAFKYGDRPEQERSPGKSKTNHSKQKKALRDWFLLKVYLELELEVVFAVKKKGNLLKSSWKELSSLLQCYSVSLRSQVKQGRVKEDGADQ